MPNEYPPIVPRRILSNAGAKKNAEGLAQLPLTLDESRFPGVQQVLIGAAIYQMAGDIAGDPLVDQIQELALQLHANGAKKIQETLAQHAEKQAKSKKKK